MYGKKVHLRIPPGTQSGTKLRIRGHGIERERASRGPDRRGGGGYPGDVDGRATASDGGIRFVIRTETLKACFDRSSRGPAFNRPLGRPGRVRSFRRREPARPRRKPPIVPASRLAEARRRPGELALRSSAPSLGTAEARYRSCTRMGESTGGGVASQFTSPISTLSDAPSSAVPTTTSRESARISTT